MNQCVTKTSGVPKEIEKVDVIGSAKCDDRTPSTIFRQFSIGGMKRSDDARSVVSQEVISLHLLAESIREMCQIRRTAVGEEGTVKLVVICR